MGIGYLKVEVFTGSEALPVGGAYVIIRSTSGDLLYELKANENGTTEMVSLEAPDKLNTLNPYEIGGFYSTYDVEIRANGYMDSSIRGVQIFDTETSILPVEMLPLIDEKTRIVYEQEINIPKNTLETSVNRQQPAPGRSVYAIKEVFIPDFVTVHLGTPNSDAPNVKVPFIDYIKNVGSSEIFPTWPLASLEANILCQISFVLNRIYTEWYPSRGYNFNITSSTAYDQCFIEGRNIFQSISNVVDRIFNFFIRRKGYNEPFFAQYCNGTTVTCNGLSQWGTVTLANQGYKPIDILKYYYPNDIEIVSSNKFGTIKESYPGKPLKEGDSGDAVKTMQNYLNRIRINFPLIPQINPVDGVFGNSTKNAVLAFQKTFGLIADGIIGKGTWYKIITVYTAVKRLGDLESEGERIGIGTTPPTSVLREGSRGADVVELQFILDFIAQFHTSIPTVLQNGYFDSLTKSAVIAFQTLFNLMPDGVVGPATWNRLYEVYRGIESNVTVPPSEPETPENPPNPSQQYPGYLLKLGSEGSSVQLIQQYLNKISTAYPSIPKLTVDGKFGNGTKAAVTEFQNIFGLVADGIVGPATWNKIVSEYNKINASTGTGAVPYPGSPLRVGSRGDNVALIQRYLNTISNKYPSIKKLTPDGIFGSATRDSVIAFQKQFGLSQDGVVGPATWSAIVNEYNKINSGRAIIQAMSTIFFGKMIMSGL